MKASNANKVVSVLLSVAMCPMMVPSAAFAADDDAASGASSPIEQAQSADQAEASGTSTSSSDTIAPQSEAADASTGEAAPAATANGEGAEAPTSEEGTEAAVAEVNDTSYPSLQAAIDAAARNATVKLLADTNENVTISTPYVTLDLNGYTLNGGTEKGKPALTVTARVTVKDSSAAQTGTIKREDTAENSGKTSHYVIDVQGDGWLTFESGNVTNDSGNTEGKGASLVRVGDDSVAKYPGLNIKGGTFTQNNFIVIKVDSGDLFLNGGTLNSTDSYAIEDWHRATIKGGTVNGAVAAWTYSGGHNSDLSISGGTVNGNVESVTYDGAEGKTAKVSITGGTVNGTLSAGKYNSDSFDDPTKATIEVTGGTFSTDPSRYLVESSTATKNEDGTYGVEKAYLARVGETSYYTIDEAFEAQTTSGEAITLLRDYTTGSTFNSGTVARVVDLNGHTWTCTGTDANSAAFEINNPNASLTVKNGKVVSSQLIGLIPSAMGGTITYDNSTLTFEGVEASTTATSGIETNGNNTNDTVVLKNSTLNVPNGFGIYFPSSGTLTIDNSKINAKTMGAQVCSGNLNVTAGSVITVSGDPVEKLEGDGAIQDGAAISIVNRPGYKGLGQITITGGTFTAKGDNAAIKAYTWDSSSKQELTFNNSAKTVAVSGGTFSSEVSTDLCAEGCTPIANADGTYGVASGVAYVAGKGFETLQAAVDAAQDGQTVTLLADVAEDVVINKSITLDLGGKTLTNTDAGKATISVLGGTVTVKNGNVVGGTGYYNIEVTKGSNANLTLTDVTATAGNNGSSMIDNWGTMTITSGEYSGGLNVLKSEEGSTLSITGGTFTLDYATDGYTAVILVYGDTTISGGEFIQSLTTTGRWNHPQVVATGVVEGYTAITRVTGGHFVNKMSGEGIFRGIGKGTFDNFEVSGGTFNKSISEDYCADGFIPTKNADGTYGVKKGSYVAQVGSKKYETLADAIRLSTKGKTIVLLTDVEQNTQLTINKDITLDLNGKTIKNTQDIWGDNTNAILSITNGAKVTITGNGTIDAKENDCYTINVVKGDLTIENGTFYGNVSVVQVQEGILSVKGGTFDLHQKWEGSSKYLINCIDDAYADGSASVAISGGTFVGFDPNVSPEGEGTSYLAPGYAPVDNGDGTYGVVAGVAQIGTKAYATLQAAIDAAQDGETVTLLTDIVLDAQAGTESTLYPQFTISGKKLTLDMQGHKISYSEESRTKNYGKASLLTLSIDNGSDVTITGNGTIDTELGSNQAYGINILGGSNLTINNGTFYGAMTAVQVQKGGLVINDGTFLMSPTCKEQVPQYAKYIINCIDSAWKDGSATVSIKGGTFGHDYSNSPEGEGTSYLAPGYTSVANADDTYGVEEGKFTVQVTSRTTTSDSPVANVSGGGSDVTYAEGTTVTASAISGYKFVGWFVNDYSGTPYSTDLTCTVKPTSDCTMIAVYEPVSGGKFWLTVTASEFTVNDGAVQDSYLYEQYAIGASVTVNFTGSENFLYWVNASNKVVSTDKSYTFTMGSETTLKAVYSKARQNQATVVFVSNSDQIISSKAYTTSDTIQFPVPPIKMGCTFTGWSMTEDQIHAAMANNRGIIEVRALYTEPSIDCAVTVVYPDGTDNEVVNTKVGQLVNVTAKDIEGKTFSYWTDNDGNILGYTKTLKLAPSADMTVKAIYSDGAAEAKPVISMTAVDASAGDGYYVISFTVTRAVPEGYELVKQGVLYSIDSRCAGDAGKDYLKLTEDGTVPEGVYESIGSNNDLNGVTRVNGKVRTADTTLYGRGYMILKNSAGEVLYVYTDRILSGSYNSLNNGGN